MDSTVAKALVSMIMGHFDEYSVLYLEMGSTYKQTEKCLSSDRLSELFIKLKALMSSDQSCDTCIFISNKVDESTYQSSEECFPDLSKDKNPKISLLKYTHIIWANRRKRSHILSCRVTMLKELQKLAGKTHMNRKLQELSE